MIRILVDTAADYNKEEFETNGVEKVSMKIIVGDKTYTDAVDLGKDQFYEVLTQNEEFPKTSQPSPQEFLEIFKDAKEKGDEVICINLSSALSGTCQSATLAKGMVDYDKIYLVDSLTATAGIKILAETARKRIAENKTAKEIVVELEELKGRVKVFAGVDTLEYLYKGGRLSKAAAAIGETVNIKPIITVTEEGTVGIAKKCIGKKQAIINVKNLIKDKGIDTNYPAYSVYTYGTENLEALEEKLAAEGINITERCQIGASIGAHVGPGAFGLFFVTK